jgi:hypothetical protein
MMPSTLHGGRFELRFIFVLKLLVNTIGASLAGLVVASMSKKKAYNSRDIMKISHDFTIFKQKK